MATEGGMKRKGVILQAIFQKETKRVSEYTRTTSASSLREIGASPAWWEPALGVLHGLIHEVTAKLENSPH